MDPVLRVLQSWGVPVAMTGVYAVLAWSSETDNTGKAWMAIGLGFVLVVWFIFRVLAEHAALARAVAVGDAARILELTRKQLARKKRPAVRAPYLVHQAFAHELRGDWPAARAALDEVRLDLLPPPRRAVLGVRAAAVRISTLIATGELTMARRVLDDELAPASAALDPRFHAAAALDARLAQARVLAAEGQRAEARPALQRVLDDIRAGAAQRAIAHHCLATLATEPADAARHRAEIARLVPDEETYLRRDAAAAAAG